MTPFGSQPTQASRELPSGRKENSQTCQKQGTDTETNPQSASRVCGLGPFFEARTANRTLPRQPHDQLDAVSAADRSADGARSGRNGMTVDAVVGVWGERLRL